MMSSASTAIKFRLEFYPQCEALWIKVVELSREAGVGNVGVKRLDLYGDSKGKDGGPKGRRGRIGQPFRGTLYLSTGSRQALRKGASVALKQARRAIEGEAGPCPFARVHGGTDWRCPRSEEGRSRYASGYSTQAAPAG